MKKLMLIIATIFIAASVYSQTAATQTKQSAPKAKTVKYDCPKCGYSSDKPGTCAHCKVALVQEGMYYCPSCGAASSKAGKCTKCNKDMVKMEPKKGEMKKM